MFKNLFDRETSTADLTAAYLAAERIVAELQPRFDTCKERVFEIQRALWSGDAVAKNLSFAKAQYSDLAFQLEAAFGTMRQAKESLRNSLRRDLETRKAEINAEEATLRGERHKAYLEFLRLAGKAAAHYERIFGRECLSTGGQLIYYDPKPVVRSELFTNEERTVYSEAVAKERGADMPMAIDSQLSSLEYEGRMIFEKLHDFDADQAVMVHLQEAGATPYNTI